jgi:hypothetical protein
VAPGKQHYNVLSKRYLFRAVILLGAGEEQSSHQGPLVLEAKDGSYKYAYEFEDAVQDGRHLIFDFYVKDRDKEYECYLAGARRRYRWPAIPKEWVGLRELAAETAAPR